MANDGSGESMPKALTDFVFDLYDSVTVSQLPEEQTVLYETDFKDLSQKYFASTPWPAPMAIAGECNGDPLFLAVYRELTHRHWHAVSRPNLRDRLEGWHVYRELFEEIFESTGNTNFYLLPSWTFDILNEFVYQFQGFCQIRSAVYSSARKHGLVNSDGSRNSQAHSTANAHLIENLQTLENQKETWDVELVFSYLHRLTQIGWPAANAEAAAVPVVYTYLSVFSAVSTSRLECLLGDYAACLQALAPLSLHGQYSIPKDMEGDDKKWTVKDVVHNVFGARVSVAYHGAVSLLLLRRYKDAIKVLATMCSVMQRGFKTGTVPGALYNKQYDRMLALLALLLHISPSLGAAEESVLRAVREKHGSKLEAATNYEEWFQSPKFVSANPEHAVYYQQIQRFNEEMEAQPTGSTLRSYLRLYTGLPVAKLAHFHDLEKADDFLPLLWAYKLRMRQLERTSEESSYEDAEWKTALDIHYYVVGDIVHVDEAERPRRFENFFVAQIAQNNEIRQDAAAIEITKLSA
jgi:translation initiation factor 3 subunit L